MSHRLNELPSRNKDFIIIHNIFNSDLNWDFVSATLVSMGRGYHRHGASLGKVLPPIAHFDHGTSSS